MSHYIRPSLAILSPGVNAKDFNAADDFLGVQTDAGNRVDSTGDVKPV